MASERVTPAHQPDAKWPVFLFVLGGSDAECEALAAATALPAPETAVAAASTTAAGPDSNRDCRPPRQAGAPVSAVAAGGAGLGPGVWLALGVAAAAAGFFWARAHRNRTAAR